MDEKLKKEFISFLIDSNVLTFGEFITKSKRKTPYFINSGNFKTGKQLNRLGGFYAKLIMEKKIKFDALFGPAYKGIALAVSCCNALFVNYDVNVPFFFNRKEEKDHGEGGSFIGYKPKAKEQIIIIEDVLTAGTAISEVVPVLKSTYDICCEEMFVMVDRCEVGLNLKQKATTYLKETFNINVNSLVNILDILEYVKNNENYLKYLKDMKDYINQYCKF